MWTAQPKSKISLVARNQIIAYCCVRIKVKKIEKIFPLKTIIGRHCSKKVRKNDGVSNNVTNQTRLRKAQKSKNDGVSNIVTKQTRFRKVRKTMTFPTNICCNIMTKQTVFRHMSSLPITVVAYHSRSANHNPFVSPGFYLTSARWFII